VYPHSPHRSPAYTGRLIDRRIDASLTVVRAALTRERIAALPEDDWPPRRDRRGGREGGRGLRLGFLSQLEMMLLTADLSGPTGRENRAQG